MSPSPYLRRATTSVLVAVGLISGAILLLGDRFDAAPGYALTQPVRIDAHIAACVAEESMRLIDSGRERCQPGELALESERVHASADSGQVGPPGSPGRAGLDGVAGFEIVTAKVEVPKGQTVAGEARCPVGKVALGGGVLPDPASPRNGGAPEDRMDVVVSAPLLPGGADAGGYGWRATVKNTAGGPLSLVVAALCVTLR
jgi:hypothetical protein